MTHRTTRMIGRPVLAVAVGASSLALGLINGGVAVSAGGLCHGRRATHSWLDASGQPGPAIIDGTRGNDVIIGTNGDDTINGRGGNDVICAGPGNDSITVGPGGNAVVDTGASNGRDVVRTVGKTNNLTVVTGSGNATVEVGTVNFAFLQGGPGNDTFIHLAPGFVEIVAYSGFHNTCIIEAGDQAYGCD